MFFGNYIVDNQADMIFMMVLFSVPLQDSRRYLMIYWILFNVNTPFLRFMFAFYNIHPSPSYINAVAESFKTGLFKGNGTVIEGIW